MRLVTSPMAQMDGTCTRHTLEGRELAVWQ